MFAYLEAFMPLLQVRNVPEDLYDALSKVAAAENRSIAQETYCTSEKGAQFQARKTFPSPAGS
jgi:hypothetical protein